MMDFYLFGSFVMKMTTKITYKFFIIVFLSVFSSYSIANENVTRKWCNSTIESGYTLNHPIPAVKNAFDSCPGRTLKKIPFDRVTSHYSGGDGKKHICNLTRGASRSNKRLVDYIDLVEYLKLNCIDWEKEKLRKQKIAEEIRAAEQAKKEKERQLQIERERRIKAEQEKIKKKAEEIARKKKFEEEKARKKKEAEEKARQKKEAEEKARQKKLDEYKRKASNFYKDIESFVKAGGDIDLVKLSDYFAIKPNPKDNWNNNDFSNFKNLRDFMTSIPQFVTYEKERIAERFKNSFAKKDKSLAELKQNLKELNGLMRKMFGSSEVPKIKDMIKDIQSALSDFNQIKADNVIKVSSSYLADKLKKSEKPTKIVKKNNLSLSKPTNSSKDTDWSKLENDLTIQQQQFCQLTDRFYDNLNVARKSKNEIKVNMVHKERQENLDALIPQGKINNWIFKVVKIDQVEDGSAAVVLGLQCRSFVGSGQTIDIKSGMSKRDKKQWRATIPYDDRRFRELAKLDQGQFIVGSGTMLEIGAYKPGQKETFYASQQIGEHPLTKGLNLEGELFIADLSYIAALN